MNITEILNARNVKLNMVARNKKQAIEELTDLLLQDGSVTNRDDFIRDVWRREAQGSTGFENHIAIPHGKSSAVSHTTLAIGRTQHEIPWESLDGSDIRCIILFAVRLEDQNTPHIRLLTQVSSALADDKVIASLLVENNPENIINIFSKYA
ncbi:PTS sugar transporter subunit IIA [Erwinia psidii]|uniref:PTS sugar transporter subunit IIA n=1 Tax=Erwinia psidii TaxID=69224 RepID=A0A3N6UX36_9GAMM|nr:fructose PTS transporter subunit IIA [Erwinia psidii]MCX8958495.1 PTS sugar transporter subunit IIA [Erwinia psidii]MCX8961998.1 PTS sugar transporter subunit IIA [Erwinia psidii]MCX8965672.1 PTS sugar transporter subunit IIA [Erwinia psidii]RQM37405.1 PTS sugar transporter subunit IIA [Erwinia psidii]